MHCTKLGMLGYVVVSAPHPAFQTLCPQVRRLSIGTPQEQRAFLFQRLQPYRVETNNGGVDGLLTGYYEPEMNATRLPSSGYNVPLYGLPANLGARANRGIRANKLTLCPKPKLPCKAGRLLGCLTP